MVVVWHLRSVDQWQGNTSFQEIAQRNCMHSLPGLGQPGPRVPGSHRRTFFSHLQADWDLARSLMVIERCGATSLWQSINVQILKGVASEIFLNQYRTKPKFSFVPVENNLQIKTSWTLMIFNSSSCDFASQLSMTIPLHSYEHLHCHIFNVII